MRRRVFNYGFVVDVLRELPEIIRDRDILLSEALNDAAFFHSDDFVAVQGGSSLFQQDRFLADSNRKFAEELDFVVKAMVEPLGFLPACDFEVIKDLFFCFTEQKQEDVGEAHGMDARQVRRIVKRCCLDSGVKSAACKVLPVVERWRRWRDGCQRVSLRRFGF